jgi:ABC-2 type transport system permease protein
MTAWRALLGKEALESWRTTRLPIVVIVFLLLGFSSPLLARFTPQLLEAVGGDQFRITLPTPTAADAVDQLLKNLGQFGALVAVLLAMGAVATEKERGTAALIMTKPVGRGAFLGAKLVMIGATLLLATFVGAAGAWFYTLVLFEALPLTGFAAAALLQFLALFSFAAITFLGSVLTRSAVAAGGFGIAALLVLGIAGAFPAVGRYLPVGLGTQARAFALGVSTDPWPSVAGSVALIVAVIALSWVAFRRQEL